MKSIRHTATLYYYDGPQVFEARDGIGGHYVGVMVEPANGCDRYLVAGVAPDRLHQFRSGALDLRELLRDESEGVWFLATAESGWDQPLTVLPQCAPLAQSDLLPDAGFVLEEVPSNGHPVASNLASSPVTLEGALEKADAVSGAWRLATSQDKYSGVTKAGGPALQGLRIGASYRFNCLEEIEDAGGKGREQRTLYLTEYEAL